MSSLSNRFAILIKKGKGFERSNEEVIRALETDGWRADRNRDKKFVVIRTMRSDHIYRDDTEIKRYLTSLLSKTELQRIILVKE